MHAVVHFDIPVKNPAQEKAFFEKLFKWKFKEIPEMKYWVIQTGPTDEKGMLKATNMINGGMSISPDVTHPYLTIHVDDIDATMKAIEEAGGTVVSPKSPIGKWGFQARFTDPEGNLIGLHEGQM